MAVGVDNRRTGVQRKPLVFIQTIVDNSDYNLYFPQNIIQQREEEGEWWYRKGTLWRVRWKQLVKLWVVVMIFRLVNGWLVKSSFDPDEYWQSMEVAHHFSFGYGHLTWEWSERIRGTLHPLIFSGIYSTLQWVGGDGGWAVQWAPRFFQCFLLSIQDILVYLLAIRLFPCKYPAKPPSSFSSLFLSPSLSIANWTLLCSLCNWFNWYCGVRTYSNTMEGFFISLAVLFWPFSPILQIHCLSYNFPIQVRYHWKPVPSLLPFPKHHLQSIISLFLAGFSCVIRPTAGIVWIILFLIYLFSPSPFTPPISSSSSHPSSNGPITTKMDFIIDVVVVAGVWVGMSAGIDRWVYGEWVVVPWEFVKTNIIKDVGSYYGTHPFHWYFSSALPTVYFSLLPLFLLGLYLTLRSQLFFNFNEGDEDEDDMGDGDLLDDMDDIDDPMMLDDDSLDNDNMILDDEEDTNNNNNNNNNGQSASQGEGGGGGGDYPANTHANYHNNNYNNNNEDEENIKGEFANFGGPIAFLVCSVILLLSFIGHKEFRFLYPLLPLSLPLCGLSAHYLLNYFHRISFLQSRKAKKRLLIIAIVLPNLPMICYFSLYHQVGGISAMEYFQTHQTDEYNTPIESIYFLMPCHSTPYYSFIHRNITMSFLDCSPPIAQHKGGGGAGSGATGGGAGSGNNNVTSSPSEQTLFYSNPSSFLASKFGYGAKEKLPTHFVVYDRLLTNPDVLQFFISIGYSEVSFLLPTY